MVFHQLIGDAANEDFIGNTPEADRRMIIILSDQLLHLADAVLVGRRVRIHHADEGDLRPDNKAQLVAGVIEILGVLIVSQTDGVGSQLLDELCILVMILPGKSIALIKTVLVTAYAAKRKGSAV